MQDDDLWALPQFLDEDELMNDLDGAQVPQFGRVESTNSNSTCHSDLGARCANHQNMIDNFTGNFGYPENFDGSLKLKRQNAMRFDEIERPHHPIMSAQEAQQQTSDALHEAFFGSKL